MKQNHLQSPNWYRVGCALLGVRTVDYVNWGCNKCREVMHIRSGDEVLAGSDFIYDSHSLQADGCARLRHWNITRGCYKLGKGMLEEPAW